MYKSITRKHLTHGPTNEFSTFYLSSPNTSFIFPSFTLYLLASKHLLSSTLQQLLLSARLGLGHEHTQLPSTGPGLGPKRALLPPADIYLLPSHEELLSAKSISKGMHRPRHARSATCSLWPQRHLSKQPQPLPAGRRCRVGGAHLRRRVGGAACRSRSWRTSASRV